MIRGVKINRLLPWMLVAMMGTGWGLTFSLARMLVEGGAAPIGITFFQCLFSVAVLFALNAFRGKPLRPMFNHYRLVMLVAVLGAALPSPLLYFAAEHVQAGVLSITIALIPMLTYAMSIPLRMENFKMVRMLGLGLGLLAIGLITLPESSLPDRAAIPWLLLACLSASCYAMENVVLGFRSVDAVGPVRLSLGMNAGAAVLLLPLVVLTDSFVFVTWPLDQQDFALVGLAAISITAYTTLILVVQRFGPVFASQTGYVVTLTGVFWGMAIFGESHSAWVWMALLAMMAGLALVKPARGQACQTEESG